MSKKDTNIDNEVYFLGSEMEEKKKKSIIPRKWMLFSFCAIILIVVGVITVLWTEKQTPEYYFEPEEATQQTVLMPNTDSINVEKGYLEVLSDTINDVPLSIYIPHKATMSLQIGIPDKSDSTIIFAAMAADIRLDNKQIVGDFILNGEKIARGTAKKGFCAIIDETVSIGVGENTELLEQAIEKKGSFFRQYPLVYNGELIENKPKNKSIRRALAIRDERVIMVESKNNESFHDFSQALIDIGVTDAIYLVGGNAYGWYVNKDRTREEFGVELTEVPENISYITWRVK